MNTQKLISLAASILITAGSVTALAAFSNGAVPPTTAATSLGGLPVTDLPGITVHPAGPARTVKHVDADAVHGAV